MTSQNDWIQNETYEHKTVCAMVTKMDSDYMYEYQVDGTWFMRRVESRVVAFQRIAEMLSEGVNITKKKTRNAAEANK